jgi:hypothetical protein
MVWYRTDCTVVPYRLCCLGLSILMYRPGQMPDRSSVTSGELQAEGNSIFLYLTGVLL